MRFRFHFQSFIIFLAIFVTEVIIALFVRDAVIRPYGGDVLVVIMIYYFAKTFVDTNKLYLLAATLLFAYAVEIAQYFHLIEILNLQDNKIMAIVIGSSFSWGDMLCYTLGAAICYIAEKRMDTKRNI